MAFQRRMPLAMEEREAGALLVEAEEVEVAADAAVVALAGQLEASR